MKYEDLVSRPDRVIPELARFLNIDSSRVDEFLKNYDYHRKMSIALYSGGVEATGISPKGISRTHGKPEREEAVGRDNQIMRLLLCLTRNRHLEQYFNY